MDWKSIGKAIAGVAPVLGSVLTGPVGPVVTAAGSLLASCLGVEPEPEKVQEAISSNPDLLIRLKELELRHQDRILKWQEIQLQADLENLKSARNREVELAKTGSKAHYATSLVSLVVTVGFFVLLYVTLQKKEVSQAGLLMLGTLSAGFGAVIQYYLGSSLGDHRKNEFLAQNGLKTAKK
ncbi:hypothetical protein [Desulfovulcanus sp.]